MITGKPLPNYLPCYFYYRRMLFNFSMQYEAYKFYVNYMTKELMVLNLLHINRFNSFL